jgi:N-acetylglutamate synthase-like GNAT family acetyltransferase
MSYRIREAELSDADKIKDCIRESFEKYVPLIHKEPEPMTFNYADIIKEKSVFILEDDSKFVGAIVLSDGDDSFMWLDILGVYNKYQHKGYGKKLIEFGEATMRKRGAKESRIKTNVKFEKTIEIYRHLKYEIYDKKIEHGYDRVFLRKELLVK